MVTGCGTYPDARPVVLTSIGGAAAPISAASRSSSLSCPVNPCVVSLENDAGARSPHTGFLRCPNGS
ncbi:hypothetical protein WME94_24715 [Sorangium sp. So ce429]